MSPSIHQALSGAKKKWLGVQPTVVQVEELAKISLCNQPSKEHPQLMAGTKLGFHPL